MKKVIIISTVSTILVIAFVIGLVAVILSGRDLDYVNDDLSKYIEISKSDYKDFSLELLFDDVTEADVERKIMQLLYKNRDPKPKYDGGNVKNLPITVGDKVYIYYRGYTVDENGVERDIKNASNLLYDMTKLEIGSLSFAPGFEESLIGKNPIDYPQFELKDRGDAVSPGDVIYLTYKAIFPDGTTKIVTSERIDLSAPYVDSLYGEGFKAFFEGEVSLKGTGSSAKLVGTKISDTLTIPYGSGTAIYYDMTITHATSCEQNPLTIEAYFPADYQDAGMRGKNVKFDVYIRYINVYDTPEYNEEFILSTLKITEEQLSSYTGSIVEKHRAFLFDEAKKENEETRKKIIEEAVWEYYHSKVKVKKLPESEVNDVYRDYYNEISAAFNSYNTTAYANMDTFAAAYLGIEEGADWRAYITEKAEQVITEKLIFYYIIDKENIKPDKATFNEIYNNSVNEYLDYYKEEIYSEELGKITDEAALSKRIEEIKKEMIDYYGKEYFEEIVYYQFAIDKIIAFATVIEK
jgi:FKBP-type peptidyl-prolyl cis-trans isomerase (trigger factor)